MCSVSMVVCIVLGDMVCVGIGVLMYNFSLLRKLCWNGCDIVVLFLCEKKLFYSLCNVIGIIGMGVCLMMWCILFLNGFILFVVVILFLGKM